MRLGGTFMRMYVAREREIDDVVTEPDGTIKKSVYGNLERYDDANNKKLDLFPFYGSIVEADQRTRARYQQSAYSTLTHTIRHRTSELDVTLRDHIIVMNDTYKILKLPEGHGGQRHREHIMLVELLPDVE